MNYKLLEGWKKSRVTRCLVKTCLGVVNEDVFRRGKTGGKGLRRLVQDFVAGLKGRQTKNESRVLT